MTQTAKSCARSSAVRLQRRPLGGHQRQVPAEAGTRRKAAPAPCEVKPGINRVWWNLRTERATEVKLRTPPAYSPDVPLGHEGFRAAPSVDRVALLVPPGTYTVTLTVGGEKSTQKLNVLKDPHSTGSEDDIRAQLQLVSALRDEMNALAESVNQIESIRAQLTALDKQLGSDDESKAIRKAAGELADKLDSGRRESNPAQGDRKRSGRCPLHAHADAKNQLPRGRSSQLQ